jgi:hypothetical protein
MAVDTLRKEGAAPCRSPAAGGLTAVPRSDSAISSVWDSRMLVRQIRLSERVAVGGWFRVYRRKGILLRHIVQFLLYWVLK